MYMNNSFCRKDFYLVTIIGFLVGWLILLPLSNIGIVLSPIIIFASVIGFSLFAPIALFILNILARVWSVFGQFGKFAAVGTLNTLIDIGILNIFIMATGFVDGFQYAGFKAISFFVATTNSYFWNKFWTFESRTKITGNEYARFFLFTLIGTSINVFVASIIVNAIEPFGSISPKLWANIGALVAVFVSFMWNFLSYRLVVFSKDGSKDPASGA